MAEHPLQWFDIAIFHVQFEEVIFNSYGHPVADTLPYHHSAETFTQRVLDRVTHYNVTPKENPLTEG